MDTAETWMQAKQVRKEEKLKLDSSKIHPDVIELIGSKIAKATERLRNVSATPEGVKKDIATVVGKITTIKKSLTKDIKTVSNDLANLIKKIAEDKLFVMAIISKVGMIDNIISKNIKASKGIVSHLVADKLTVGGLIVSAKNGISSIMCRTLATDRATITLLAVKEIITPIKATKATIEKVEADKIAANNVISDKIKARSIDGYSIDAKELAAKEASIQLLKCGMLNGVKANVIAEVLAIPTMKHGIVQVGKSGVTTADDLFVHSKLSGLNEDCHKQYILANGRGESQEIVGGTEALILRGSKDTTSVSICGDTIKTDGKIKVNVVEAESFSKIRLPKYASVTDMAKRTLLQDDCIGVVNGIIHTVISREVKPLQAGSNIVSRKLKLEAGKPTVVDTGNINPAISVVSVVDMSRGGRVVNDCVLECRNNLTVTVNISSVYRITTIGV